MLANESMNIAYNKSDAAIILVVDDVLDNLRFLTDILTREGYKVRQAIDGKIALKTVNAIRPDLILLDIMMPDINGYDVCKILKSDPNTQDIPIIFLSALNEVWDKVRAFQVGGSDCISKPFQQEEVLARVVNQIKIYKLSQQLKEQNTQLKESEAREREKASQLERTISELKRTQTQLIQSEKMASLGQLVAGIAHEINNPVNFIYGNLEFVRNYFKDLLKLVDVYQQSYPEPTLEIQDVYNEIDLAFLLEDWEKPIDSMQIGAERIHGIVRSLQTFSKCNTSKNQSIALHEILDNTLLLLKSRLKQAGNAREIKVIKNYGRIPNITGYGNQLDRVFMSLLVNAIEALEPHSSPELSAMLCEACQDKSNDKGIYCHKKQNPTIHICTNFKDNIEMEDEEKKPEKIGTITIGISDNGCGIDSEVQKRIFDPFFTTKSVGMGTGLGLSISYQIIVEQHEGQLYCISTPGEGTEFVIELPVTSGSQQKISDPVVT